MYIIQIDVGTEITGAPERKLKRIVTKYYICTISFSNLMEFSVYPL